MFIGASEGQVWRYEVTENPDGFLVSQRDLSTGQIEADETKLFRTAAVAFAYAELSAAFERYAAARILDGEDAAQDAREELVRQQALFDDLSARLGDSGLAAHLLTAPAPQRRARILH